MDLGTCWIEGKKCELCIKNNYFLCSYLSSVYGTTIFRTIELPGFIPKYAKLGFIESVKRILNRNLIDKISADAMVLMQK